MFFGQCSLENHKVHQKIHKKDLCKIKEQLRVLNSSTSINFRLKTSCLVTCYKETL